MRFASLTGGAQDTPPLTWFASKPRSPKETAKALFETSVSARAAGVICSASVDFVYTMMGDWPVLSVSPGPAYTFVPTAILPPRAPAESVASVARHVS